MENKLLRLSTFNSWPETNHMHPVALADSGFFYTDNADEVQCFSCNVKIHNWKPDDIPNERHRYESPGCRVVSQIKENTSINQERNIHQYVSQPSFPGAPIVRQSTPIKMKSNEDVLKVLSDNQGRKGCEWFKPRSISNSENAFPRVDYRIEANRIASFENRWCVTRPLQPVELAAAGLFFTGPGDRVQCAYCRGGLYNWDHGDTAIGEHIKHFPLCNFAKEKMDSLQIEASQQHQQINSEYISYDVGNDSTPRQEEWDEMPAVQIAKDMGYNMDVIKKAVENVLSVSCSRLSSHTLMDEIFNIENSMTKHENSMTKHENSHVGDNNGEVAKSVLDETTNQLGELEIDGPGDVCSTSLEGAVGGEPAVEQHNNQTTVEAQVSQLLAENERLKGTTTCKVCLDNEVDILFLPCRHLVCCENCSNSLKECPCCRTHIIGTVKTYLS